MGEHPANDAPFRLIDRVEFGADVVVQAFTNLYRCRIGDRTRVGPFVEIQHGVTIGADCKISSHSFVCTGVEIRDQVFVGHGVMFTNDKTPRAHTDGGRLQEEGDWELLPIVVGQRASIGSAAVILGGVTIGEGALIGAGAVVTRDVEPRTVVVGNPGRVLRRLGELEQEPAPRQAGR